MSRNAEVIRQWSLLREIERQRHGATIDELAKLGSVTTRTIRRDLDALQQAGFPLYDQRIEGRTRWTLDAQPFKGLETGFTLSELCALYFSRTLLECFAGAPFQADLSNAFKRFEAVLSPRMRQFLDRLPQILTVKAAPKRDDAHMRRIIASIVDATLYQRKADMQYHSFSSNRTKDYRIDPYRLVYGQGGLYLFAFVPEYGEMRTFAVERIRRLSLLDKRYVPIDDVSLDAFAHSLGIHQGTPEAVEVEFDARVAPYIKERLWHPSQETQDGADGALVVRLRVSIDWALRSWILSFGPFARVMAPASLANQILDDIDRARAGYAPYLVRADSPVIT